MKTRRQHSKPKKKKILYVFYICIFTILFYLRKVFILVDLKKYYKTYFNYSLLFFRNRIVFSTPFAKINKGGLNKRSPRLNHGVSPGKEKHFSVFEKQKNTLGSRVKKIGKLK